MLYFFLTLSALGITRKEEIGWDVGVKEGWKDGYCGEALVSSRAGGWRGNHSLLLEVMMLLPCGDAASY